MGWRCDPYILGNGKSFEDTSSTGCCSIVMLIFGGVCMHRLISKNDATMVLNLDSEIVDLPVHFLCRHSALGSCKSN